MILKKSTNEKYRYQYAQSKSVYADCRYQKKRKRANHKINVKNLENNIVSFLKN